ncbi:glycerophosphodiester phosphodiesterase family protein [Shimia ponticola]|uniref:glycerophosphodiester phosphodiesterase family protein n=1 Tax=Shimia ponticola TaxID=2582893 RepID=UPI0011BE9704|nr:glycerophosphodiester phosphodiesterase family protein [Shimia ponticola]
MKFIRVTLIALVLICGLLWLNNTSAFVDASEGSGLKLIAHRGVHQQYVGVPRTNDTCRARNMAPREHDFIENTVPSITAAFAYGADVVEIDVHRTTDDVLVVFHDWTLECQTNGTGETKSKTFAELASLDLGYGFTEDGTTFPLRGTAVGAIPRLDALLETEFEGRLLVNFKSDRRSDGRHLATLLETGVGRDNVFAVYGGRNPTQAVIAETEDMRGYDRTSLKTCARDYLLLGWSGYIPSSCHNTLIGVPMDFAPLAWGWPHKFTKRMASVGTEVILWGPYDGSGFTSGINDAETFARVPDGFDGYVWTDVIEKIGPLAEERR